MDAEPQNNTAYDVFISHRSLYKPWVETLAHNLRKRGYKVWLDTWELVPGRNFAPGLQRGLDAARKGILVATPDAVDSGWVREEYEAMLSRKQRDPGFSIVPLVFGEFPDLPFLANVHCVDFRDPLPVAYRRAFYLLLCGLEDRPPGPDWTLEGELDIPEPLSPASGKPQPLQGSEQAFLEEIFTTLARLHQPLLLLAQADRGQGDLIQAILERARRRFGEANTLYMTPPYSQEAEEKDYFARLGRQCRFTEATDSAIQWEDALDQRLERVDQLLLLVSSFEQGSDTGRRKLAGVLRSLSERHTQRLQVVLCGGERLAELRYGPADLSLLNHAEVLLWPELTVADVLVWQEARDCPDSPPVGEDEAQALLTVCGGHPRLLRHCLQQRCHYRETAGLDWRRILEQYRFLSDVFLPYREDAPVSQRLCQWLNREELGPFDDWPADRLLRQLYWNNLLVERERRFVWRCEILRAAGRRVLGCGAS